MSLPSGAELLEASGKHGTGNVLLKYTVEGEQRVLKIYRCRRSRIRELLRDFSQRSLEGKRGACAEARCETEVLSVDLWRREGFPVVKQLHKPIPDDVHEPALWLEFIPDRRLDEVLRDDVVPKHTKLRLLKLLGTTMSARHYRATQIREPLLVHEHGNVNHYFVRGDRLIAFDLENGYTSRLTMLEAVAQELSGLIRSIVRIDEGKADEYLTAFVDGYAQRELLAKAIQHALEGKGVVRAAKRWYDRKTRGRKSKTDAMMRAHRVLTKTSVPPA